MKSFSLVLMFCIAWGSALAQEPAQPAPPAQPQSIAKSLGMYVFPAQGQEEDKQIEDEGMCYSWALKESGVDPMNLPEGTAPPPQSGATGDVVGGAARGAVAGTVIGAIAGDAGKGAAIGAAAGGMGGLGRRQARGAQQQAQAQAQNEAQKQAALDSFKKAFSACMEAKGYTVK